MKGDINFSRSEMQTVRVSPKCLKIGVVFTIIGGLSLIWYMNTGMNTQESQLIG